VAGPIEQIAKGRAVAGGWPTDKTPQVHVRKDEFVSATYDNRQLIKRLIGVWKNSLGGKMSRWSTRRWGAKISPNSDCRSIRSPRLYRKNRNL
jgi:hypothetical protein